MPSRKLKFSSYIAASIAGAWLVTAAIPSLSTTLDTVVMGLVSVLVAFCGGNVASKWANGKAAKEPEID